MIIRFSKLLYAAGLRMGFAMLLILRSTNFNIAGSAHYTKKRPHAISTSSLQIHDQPIPIEEEPAIVLPSNTKYPLHLWASTLGAVISAAMLSQETTKVNLSNFAMATVTAYCGILTIISNIKLLQCYEEKDQLALEALARVEHGERVARLAMKSWGRTLEKAHVEGSETNLLLNIENRTIFLSHRLTEIYS